MLILFLFLNFVSKLKSFYSESSIGWAKKVWEVRIWFRVVCSRLLHGNCTSSRVYNSSKLLNVICKALVCFTHTAAVHIVNISMFLFYFFVLFFIFIFTKLFITTEKFKTVFPVHKLQLHKYCFVYVHV